MADHSRKRTGYGAKLWSWVFREAAIVSILLLTAGGTWVFVEVADEVREGDLQHIDKSLLLLLRNPADHTDPIGPNWFEEAARDLTALGGVALLSGLSIGVCGYLLLRGETELFLLMATAALGAILLSFSMKYAFDRPRPDLVPHGSYVYTRSFPSGHSMMAATIYLTIAVMLTRIHSQRTIRIYIFALCILTTLLVSASRVYLGVHWPSDVLAGWVAGSVWAAICYLLATWRRRWWSSHAEDAPPESAPPQVR